MNQMEKGYLALVLHAHLPYVRHPEKTSSLEENWFFEALTETYIPLINVLDMLIHDGVDFNITISLSPTLISMMSDMLLVNRYERRLEQLIELANREIARTRATKFESLARMYLDRIVKVKNILVKHYDRQILNAFRQFRDRGTVELITSCATHGYLPLMISKESVRAQVGVAVDLFTRHFGSPPKGMWLPECAYEPGIDNVLKDFEIRYFFTESHGVLFSTPIPVNGVYSPVITPSGVAAFGRESEASRQVWDKHQGYPGDYQYREFYRDIGYDMELDYIGPYIGEKGTRIDTGFKYFRVTGDTDQKQLYDPQEAESRAAEHAGNFMFNREKQVEHLSTIMDRPPVIVAPYDAELFGHWWYEGPRWIDILLRKIHYDQESIKTITPLKYLEKYPENQVGVIAASSWGHNGYNEVWLDDCNAWIYRHLHKAEKRMVRSAASYPDAKGLVKRALNQMARELLLAQSSDWAFIIKSGTTVEYACKRFRDHISRFNRLYWAVQNNDLQEEELHTLEELNPIFPEADYRYYLPASLRVQKKPVTVSLNKNTGFTVSNNIKILMLSWEFPPKTVGGLSRHVFDLSRALASQGLEIHVITCKTPGGKKYEVVDGVHVHRVSVSSEETEGFIDWIEELNKSMIKHVSSLLKQHRFDLIHAHDWLVARAGITLKNLYGIPLVSTIHATEFGRNHGIHNEVQRQINQLEWTLTYESWKVICCSKYMACEISQVFQLPANKIRIIPNGVEIGTITDVGRDEDFRTNYAASYEKIVYFIGRLVPEKGVQVLIESVPSVIKQFPNVKFVISGVGAYREKLAELADNLGVSSKIYFTGFADDQIRNMLLAAGDVAVFPSLYEPFGIVALEAMAAKVPVIVSDTGGLTEVIDHEVTGLKVQPNDVSGLADSIVRVLSNPGLTANLIESAWNKVKTDYNWITIAGDTSAVYREILQEAYHSGYIEVSEKPCL